MENNRNSRNTLLAIILIGLGIFFLLGQFLDFSIMGLLWPFFVILPGAVFLFYGLYGDKSVAALAVPGMIVTGTGAILLYQNITGHWESWAYIWTLYMVFIGLALHIIGRRTDSQEALKIGGGLMRAGLVVFAAFYFLFEGLIFNNLGSGIGRFVVPAVLVGIGLYMLLGRSGRISLSGSGDEGGLFHTRAKSKNGYSASASDHLRKRIDEALEDVETGDDEPNI